MLQKSSPATRAAAAVIVVAAVAAAVFAGVTLAGGGDDNPPPLSFRTVPPTPPPGLEPTRPAILPTQDPSRPTQPADERNLTPDPDATSLPFRIGGVTVPLPTGATLHSTVGDPGGQTTWSFHLGASFIRFDMYGLIKTEISQDDQDTFEAALDALWLVAQGNAQPSPESISVGDTSVKLPPGSYYSSFTKPFDPNDKLYTVRLGHSVLSFDSSGLVSNSVRPEDEGAFNLTLTAIEPLAVEE